MKKLIATTLTAMLVTSCGVRPTDTITGDPAPTEVLDGVVLFLVNDTILTRVVRPSPNPPATNLQLLAQGPTPEESATGLTTELPPTITATAVSATAGTLTVRISTPVGALTDLAKDQLICTAQWQSATTTVIVTGPDQTLSPRTCPFPRLAPPSGDQLDPRPGS
jgi:hypothetical protein